MAAALQVEWVEFDVRLTRDGRVVLLHDDTLERTTSGRGPASLLTFAELRRLDAGAWFGADFKGQPVPSLEEAISLLVRLGLGAVIELKPAPGTEMATGRIAARLVAELWPKSLPPPLLSSFKPAALDAARAVAPEIERALLVGKVPRDWSARLRELDCVMLHADQRRLDPRTIAELRGSGVPLFAYTVNVPERARELLGWGVDAVFSDCPERLGVELAVGARD